MDFEELHGKSGSGMNVGVDLTTLMTSQVSISTVGESDGVGSGGGGDMTVPRTASFQVYWDVRGKRFKVFSPKVVDPNGKEISVTETALSSGTYVCEVKKNKTTGAYTASIKLTHAVVPSAETVTVVKLFKIEDGKVEQYHVGAIILSGGGNSVSTKAAFDLEVTESSTGSKIGKIVRCNFVFDGENKSLSDFSVSGSGSVYLVAKQPAPSGGMGDLPWTFEISESKGEATEGGRVVNYKLYDLNDFSVTCDYRTTFMELKSPHHVSKFTVSKYEEPQTSVVIEACLDTEAKVTASDGTASATLKASNGKAETEVSDGSHSARMEADGTTAKLTLTGTKTVVVDPGDLKKGSEARFHKLTVKHADGSADDVYDVIADKDITINESAGDERLTGVDLELSEGTKLRLKLTFTDKDGSTREEYSTGITLKQVDVVSNVSWSSPTLSKSGKKLTVIEEESSGDENVFTAVPHSSNS